MQEQRNIVTRQPDRGHRMPSPATSYVFGCFSPSRCGMIDMTLPWLADQSAHLISIGNVYSGFVSGVVEHNSVLPGCRNSFSL